MHTELIPLSSITAQRATGPPAPGGRDETPHDEEIPMPHIILERSVHSLAGEEVSLLRSFIVNGQTLLRSSRGGHG